VREPENVKTLLATPKADCGPFEVKEETTEIDL